jgi:hypothetical protein
LPAVLIYQARNLLFDPRSQPVNQPSGQSAPEKQDSSSCASS